MEHGFDPVRNTFTQHYGTDEVDASLLVLSDVGFIAGDDPRMLGTIKAVEEDLMRDGLLLRYRTRSGVDGLAGDEHPFLACSFWLVEAYALAGRLDDAHALMRRLLELPNDVGLLLRGVRPGASAVRRQLPAGVLAPGPGRCREPDRGRRTARAGGRRPAGRLT